jgi:hypothetical protein
MKKLITIVALVVGTALGYSQGTIAVQNTTAGISTNTAAYGSGVSGISGPTFNAANTFYYALLYQTYTGTLTTNYAGSSAGWTFAEYGTNVSTGGIKGPGAGSGTSITGWGAPSGSTYDTGTEMYYILVGWSSNLGSTWAAVQGQLNTSSWITQSGFFGVSPLSWTYAGGGPSSLPAPNIFGTGAGPGAQGIPGSFTLYQTITVPEPSTIALAGLGALSMLLIRRRK